MSENEKKTERKDSKGFLDKVLGRAISRKLLVWVTATVALFMEVVPSEDWVAIALVYIGSQSAVDLAVAWKSAGKEE